MAEALACGKPVLISDRVNIAPTILAAQAGLVAPDTIEGTCGLLRDFLSLETTEKTALARRARACFDAHFDIDQVVPRTADVLAGLVAT